MQFTPTPQWSKIGPGIGVEFDASPAEIQSILGTALLSEFAPYNWLRFESVLKGDRVTGRTWTSIEIAETAHFLTSTITELGQRFHIYLRSRQLTPNPDWESWKFSESYCGIHGMASFQRDRCVSRSPLAPYRLGMVWKVGNVEQTEVVENVEYRKIFEALRRQFRKLNKKAGST